MEIVLAGNPNSGKTSLFNLLTGSKQHVGNWPGVTVEKKEGKITIDGEHYSLVDLPGIYSLEPDTIEQKVTRDYIFRQKPDLIINILDATNLERNLYLTLQLRETGIPMVIALNMMDEVEKSGVVIRAENLSKILGVPVIALSVKTHEGINGLVATLKGFFNKEITVQPFCMGCKNCAKCKIGENRYQFIDTILRNCVIHNAEKHIDRTDRIDKYVLNKYLALPLFFAIMFIVFFLTFGNLVSKVSDGIDFMLNNILGNFIRNVLTASHTPNLLVSAVCNGIIPGIGTVLVFLPQIALLFFLMSALEDSGYMSRAAIIMDRVFAAFGLSGSSFIPLIMGFGCTVPAIMSCRILPTEKDRKLTIMLTSFISCSARLPLYALMAGVFFAKFQGAVVFIIYLLGIMVAVLSALILNKAVFKNNNTSFVMELPPYRLPNLRNLLLHTWEKVKGFVIKAGTTLLAASVIVWLFQTFSVGLHITDNPENSIWAFIGKAISPVFAPLGFGNWKAATALLTGVAAKEMVVSTFSVLSGANGNTALLHQFISGMFTPLSAFSFMSFVLLYLPCISSISAMKKEFNSVKWTAGALVYNFCTAWAVSFIIYNIGKLFGLQ